MPPSYDTYFAKVYLKRLAYVKHVLLLASVLVAWTIGFFHNSLAWNLLTSIFVKGPIVFVALVVIDRSRRSNTVVDYSLAKTLSAFVIQQFTKRNAFTVLAYVSASLVLTGLYAHETSVPYYVVSKVYQKRPSVNDGFVFFWFYGLYTGVVYSFQHIAYQRNRLRYQYGVSKVSPEQVLFRNFHRHLGISVGLSLITSVSAPVVYLILRSSIYKLGFVPLWLLGLDTSIVPVAIGVSLVVQLAWLSFNVFVAAELANHVFDIYSTIGCLDGRKPISTYSSDPINTLLLGLKDTGHPLARLTAFQELAYIATTKAEEGVKLRNAIYTAHTRDGYLWPQFLEECSYVIKEVTSRVNYRSKADMEALEKQQQSIKEDINRVDSIFGNSFVVLSTSSPKHEPDVKKYQPVPQPTNAVIKVVGPYLERAKAAANAFFTPKAFNLDVLATDFSSKYSSYYSRFLHMPVGSLFRITLDRDTQSRVLNPVVYGNAVIALSNLLIHAVEEDKNNTISDGHIAEVLNLLERPIRSFSNYTDSLPASVYLTPQEKATKQNKHIVALLHDLTMSEFYTLCLKYNYKLNDLVLLPKAFKLAKWVIDVAIVQQQKSYTKGP